MLNWKISQTEAAVIKQIVLRAMKMQPDAEFTNLEMDIWATHANGCPLRLDDLLDADNFNFSHDVFGIRYHINRETGQLENCFLPRYAA